MNRVILNETSYFGYGARESLKDEVLKHGFKKALVVTQVNILENVTKKVLAVLDENQLAYELFENVKPNPTVQNVLDGVEKCRSVGADYILAVGGGSVIDTAKAIGIIMTNPEHGDVVSLDGAVSTANKSLPIIALPTTAGTAAEVTINYVITDEKRVKKMVCVDPNDIPIVAIIDQELMSEMPASVAASTGMDALTHAIEGYLTKAAWEMTDMFHLEAIKLISGNLERAVNDKDKDAIEAVGLGQYIAGMGFSNVGLGIVHSMAHPLGALYDTPHGVANAVILPHVMKFNSAVCKSRFKGIAHAMELDIHGLDEDEIVDKVVNRVFELNKNVGIPARLRDLYVKEEDLDWLSQAAFNDVCTGGNPREVNVEIIKELYKSIY